MEFLITWKTPAFLLLMWNFCHNKSIYACFYIVKAVMHKISLKMHVARPLCFQSACDWITGRKRVCGW